MNYITQHEIVTGKPTGIFSNVSARELLKDQIQNCLDDGTQKGFKCISVAVTQASEIRGDGTIMGTSYDVVIIWETPKQNV